jgi:hypothetical protein
MDDYASPLAKLLSGQQQIPPSDPPIFPNDMIARLMSETIVPRQPNHEQTLRALLGDKSTMNLVTPLAQDNSMAPSFGLAAQLLGPGRGPMRAPMFAAETGGAAGGAGGSNLYSTMLKDAGRDRAAFDVVFNSLSADKSLSKDALKQIAAGYTTDVPNWKTKAEMLDAIFKSYIQNARFFNKIGQ